MPISSPVRFVSPDRWRIALPLYGAAGLMLGFIVKDLGQLLGLLGLSPKLGVAGAVNLLLPGCTLFIGAWYPRHRTVWIGTCLLTLGFVIGGLVRRDWHVWAWPLSFSQNLAHPILVAGMIADGVIGSVVVWMVSRARCVGVPPDPRRCRACGYSLAGLNASVCPECGHGTSMPTLGSPPPPVIGP